MRVLFISDQSFTQREHSMFRRLELGILDEGARLVRAIPESAWTPTDTQLTRVITFPDIGPRLMRPFRVAQMLKRLAPIASHPDKPPAFDIVHAWGDRSWALAAELASITSASLVLELWSNQSLARIRSFEHANRALIASGHIAAWSAPDQTTASAAREAARWPVHVSPWGVHLPPVPRKPTTQKEPTPIVVLPEGHDAAPVIALLQGLASAMKSLPGEPPLIFIGEAAVKRNRQVWRAVESLGLAHLTSILANIESRREPVLLAEILALPEAGGEHRSITLEAMAAGQAVAHLNDPRIEAYKHERTSLAVAAPTVHRWAEAFTRLLPDPAFRRRLGLGARNFIETNRRVHPHIVSTLETYERIDALANAAKAPPTTTNSNTDRRPAAGTAR